MNRRDFVGLFLGVSISPLVLPLPEAAPREQPAGGLGGGGEVNILAPTANQCICATCEEFKAFGAIGWEKPNWALAS